MKWSITAVSEDTAGPIRPVTLALAKYQCRIDIDTTEEDDYVLFQIDAATAYAQERMACSLLTQEITAIYFTQDVFLTPAVNTTVNPFDAPLAAAMFSFGSAGQFPALKLPRGPVTAITSVVDADGHAISGWKVERMGNADRLCMTAAVLYPVTVVYEAGIASTPEAIPADIRQAILTHVGTLYANRESVSEKSVSVVPHSLDAFYRLRSRNTGIG